MAMEKLKMKCLCKSKSGVFPSVKKITGILNNNQDIQRSKFFKVWLFCLLEHSLNMPCTSPEYYLIINSF